jgi:hypothetical protein
MCRTKAALLKIPCFFLVFALFRVKTSDTPEKAAKDTIIFCETSKHLRTKRN